MDDPRKVRFENILDVGLTASAMIRLFKKDSKEMLREKIGDYVRKIFEAKSKEEFDTIHSEFCDWGIKTIPLAKKVIFASYGQIAKTFNVVLKVAIYYSHLPSYEKSKQLLEWLHAAVDTKMMEHLKQYRSKDAQEWPTTIEKVDEKKYCEIQRTVGKAIEVEYHGSITLVEFDDIKWRKLNRND